MDASSGVLHDLKGHTGGTMSLGRGSEVSKSTKQKINTTSSTETELVGTFECMSEILWTNYFLKAQGYNWDNTILYQDNMSVKINRARSRVEKLFLTTFSTESRVLPPSTGNHWISMGITTNLIILSSVCLQSESTRTMVPVQNTP